MESVRSLSSSGGSGSTCSIKVNGGGGGGGNSRKKSKSTKKDPSNKEREEGGVTRAGSEPLHQSPDQLTGHTQDPHHLIRTESSSKIITTDATGTIDTSTEQQRSMVKIERRREEEKENWDLDEITCTSDKTGVVDLAEGVQPSVDG